MKQPKAGTRIVYDGWSDSLGRCSFRIYWVTDYHPGVHNEHFIGERGQSFRADPLTHGFPRPEDDKPIMRFVHGRQYMGIKYKASALHVGIYEAQKSGVEEVFTRFGKPYSIFDAHEWIELPEKPAFKAAMFESVKGKLGVRETNRVTPCTNMIAAFEKKLNLITFRQESESS